MILAEITPTPNELFAWLGCLAFVVMLANGVFKLADRLRGKPAHPPNEQLAHAMQHLSAQLDKLLTKIEFAAHEKADTLAFGGINQAITDLRAERKVDVTLIHQRINRVSIGVAALCAKQNVPMPGEEAAI